MEDYYQQLKKRGLTPEQDARIRRELEGGGAHDLPEEVKAASRVPAIYDWSDFSAFMRLEPPQSPYTTNIRSIDELLERDRQREIDGFPRKIRVGKLVRPGKGDQGKVVIVPTTVEEKLLHDNTIPTQGEGGGGSTGGSGDGEEGEVIGEQPVHDPDQAGEGGAGQGEGGGHEIESSAYDLGRILTEKFELPNLKDKGKKRALSRYTYDLTDRNRGFGQILDKKATLRRILETNMNLGNIPDISAIDTSVLLISPNDKVYRTLSREKDYESQALVFFLRDYSGSMMGKATELVVSQHVLIYSWLLFQYERQVESRFILHDTEAREVDDFHTYYNSRVAGGTRVASAFRLVNEIVEEESLARDYNIYVFHGTDGDDWDADGQEIIPELQKMITYANRVGVTIAEHAYSGIGATEVERNLKKSGLLESRSDLVRLDIMGEDAEEPRIIEGIKKLIS
jgi:uncharacterized protein